MKIHGFLLSFWVAALFNICKSNKLPVFNEFADVMHGINGDSSVKNRLFEFPSSILSRRSGKVVETANKSILAKYVKISTPAPGDRHMIVICVKQNNLKILHNYLTSSAKVRNKQHLKRNEIGQYIDVVSSKKVVEGVLKQYNLKILDETKYQEYLVVSGSIRDLESFLATKFHIYQSYNGKRVVRSLNYALPMGLEDHISAVFNTCQFPPLDYPQAFIPPAVRGKTVSAEAATASAGHGTVTPALLNSVYGIANNTGNDLVTQAVYEALNQSYSPSDLTAFQQHFDLPVEAVANDIGGHESNNACAYQFGADCMEANLDVQYLMGVAQSIPTTYFYWNGTDPWLDWIITVANMSHPPQVISISYTSVEAYISPSYASSFDTEAMKLSLLGVTLLVASGDDGAPGVIPRYDGALYCGYYPNFPATSPYLIAVGGTMGPESGQPEVACQSDLGGIITSGGGFSDIYGAPSWQSDAINTYFAAMNGSGTLPYQGYNRNGRAYPDVSLLAYNYSIVASGKVTFVSGTSASTPVMAALLSLINAARVAAGKSTLGWITPTLYQLYADPAYSDVFNDISSGSNNCVANDLVCCNQGFTAAADAWDPVTGLGSVNYTALYNALVALDDDPNEPTIAPTALPGVPTGSPVEAPTLSPSSIPSASPTMARGWVILSVFVGQLDCSGTVTRAIGFPTDSCLVQYNSNGHAIGSVMHACTQVAASANYFSDNSCTVPRQNLTTTYFLGCNTQVDFSYATDMQCIASPDMTLPAPFNDGTHIIRNSYDGDSGCSEDTLSSFESVLQNSCYVKNKYSNGYVSYKLIFPYFLLYSTSNCAGAAAYYTLDTQCDEAPVNFYYLFDDDLLDPSTMQNEVWTNGIAPYTYAPSPAPGDPTLAPTVMITGGYTMGFSVNTTLQGISVSQYLSVMTDNNSTFAFAAAACMYGIKPQYIFVTAVTADDDSAVTADAAAEASISDQEATSPSLLDVARSLLGLTSAQSSAQSNGGSEVFTNVTFWLKFNTKEAHYETTDEALDSITQQLHTAVEDGQFTQQLHYYAPLFAATDMLQANVTGVSVATSYVTYGIYDDDDRDNTVGPGLIAGVTVVIAVVIVCVLFFGRRWCMSRNDDPHRESLIRPAAVDTSAVIVQPSHVHVSHADVVMVDRNSRTSTSSASVPTVISVASANPV